MSDTRDSILQTAVELSRRKGFTNLRRDDVAAVAGVGKGCIHYYFDNMSNLRDEVMQEAVRVNDAVIICQGLAAKHPIAQGAPEALRREAVELLLK